MHVRVDVVEVRVPGGEQGARLRMRPRATVRTRQMDLRAVAVVAGGLVDGGLGTLERGLLQLVRVRETPLDADEAEAAAVLDVQEDVRPPQVELADREVREVHAHVVDVPGHLDVAVLLRHLDIVVLPGRRADGLDIGGVRVRRPGGRVGQRDGGEEQQGDEGAQKANHGASSFRAFVRCCLTTRTKQQNRPERAYHTHYSLTIPLGVLSLRHQNLVPASRCRVRPPKKTAYRVLFHYARREENTALRDTAKRALAYRQLPGCSAPIRRAPEDT